MLTKKDKEIKLQKVTWNQTKMKNPAYQQTDKKGKEKFEQFSDLGPEVYDELFSTVPADINETPNNSWARNFLNQMKDIDRDNPDASTDYDLLRKRTKGSELWAEMATESFLQSFVKTAEHEGKIQDTQDDKQAKEYLESLLQDLNEKPKNSKKEQKIKKDLSKSIDDLSKIIKDKQDNQDQIMENMDNSKVRQAIRQSIQETNEDIKDLQDAVNSFSFGDELHTGARQASQIGKKLAPYINSSNKIKKVLQLLGRLKRAADNEIKQKPKQGTSEVVGIELGNNLERVLPSQSMYLSDPLLENVFLKRFVNHELLQYELSIEPPKEHGPMILCVDSSGSMSGDRIAWAMATVLAFLHVARKQKRDLQVIHFGSDVLRTDDFNKNDQITVEKVMETIDFFKAAGGTNFNRPIQKAIDIIARSDRYNDADIVMITDGQSNISESIEKKIKAAKNEAALKFFSIVIGCSYYDELTKVSDEVIDLQDALKDSDKINKLFAKV